MSWPPDPGGTWVLDLDGVVWLTGQAIGDAAGAIGRLRGAGVRTLFATNNSAPTVEQLVARLARIGIPATAEDLVTSAHAAATMLPRRCRVLALAAEGVTEALGERDATVVSDGPADAVVVGWTHEFDFELLARASRVVREGARLIGTNEDPTHPTPDGLMPGCGALLAAVATAAGVVPEVAGKPHQPMATLIRARANDVTVAVGDRPSTDGALAAQLDVPYALVLSGVTGPGDSAARAGADVVAADLAALVERFLGH